MIYIIDHNDSFTYNVVHQFSLYDDVECDNYNSIENRMKDFDDEYLGYKKNIDTLDIFLKKDLL